MEVIQSSQNPTLLFPKNLNLVLNKDSNYDPDYEPSALKDIIILISIPIHFDANSNFNPDRKQVPR